MLLSVYWWKNHWRLWKNRFHLIELNWKWLLGFRIYCDVVFAYVPLIFLAVTSTNEQSLLSMGWDYGTFGGFTFFMFHHPNLKKPFSDQGRTAFCTQLLCCIFDAYTTIFQNNFTYLFVKYGWRHQTFFQNRNFRCYIYASFVQKYHVIIIPSLW